MKKIAATFLPIACLILLGPGCSLFNSATSSSNTTDEKVQPDQSPMTEQSSAFDADAAIKAISAQIAGKEDLPAEEVFKNIQIMKGFPAGRILPIMKMAFNTSLGVSCDHCHNTEAWDSDEKKEKKITREMWAMSGKINRELLPSIEGLKSEQPVVNCTTCHRGALKPATNLGK